MKVFFMEFRKLIHDFIIQVISIFKEHFSFAMFFLHLHSLKQTQFVYDLIIIFSKNELSVSVLIIYWNINNKK